ncbi:MAG TPA: tol-pal system protein YbgF [Stellaceae bacterium]|nr:tol-pal system protein YbgF [Stellaceae bacterium]
MARAKLVAGLSVLALLALGTGLHAQQSNPDLNPLLDRLDRLERDVNLLQRQVYRGGSNSAPVPTPSSGDSALNAEIRMGRLEDQMRTLTGQIEESNYKIDQLRQRLDKLQSDIEFRLSALEHPGAPPPGGQPPPSGALAATPATPAAPAEQNAAALRPPPPGPSGNSSADQTQLASGPRTLGMIQVSPGQSTAPAVAAPVVPPESKPASAPAANATPQEQYNYAFNLLRQSRYDEAAQALKAFVQRNPKDPLAGNAQYWLGETYYVRKDYTNAAATFAEGYEKYPKNTKAPDNLLKLGMSLSNLGQKDNACRAFGRLDRDYPQAPGEIKERAAGERKRLGCQG